MSEVARRLGVAPSTVSRALAGHSRISEPTRRRVREMAEMLGYRIDSSASNLRTGLTRTIAVVIPLAHATRQRLSDPFFLEMLGAIGDELALRNYSMLLSKVMQPPGEWIASMIKGRRADGALIIGQSLHHEALNEAAAHGIPMVVWGERLKDQKYITVGTDNDAGAEMAMRHLFSQGCRRIVFLGDPAAPEVRARLDGYLRALQSQGIERDPRLEVAVRFGSDAAYAGVSSLLDAHVAFDGVFACSDVFGISAMRALHERGRRVPADVAVVGFDDIPLAAYTTPPLTTVRQDCATGARLLVDKVLNEIAGVAVHSEVIAPELIVRTSSLRRHHHRVATGAAQPPAGRMDTLTPGDRRGGAKGRRG